MDDVADDRSQTGKSIGPYIGTILVTSRCKTAVLVIVVKDRIHQPRPIIYELITLKFDARGS